MLDGQLQARNDKAKLTIKTESSRFDDLVTLYVAVYSLASRLTDNPREAIALTGDAFDSIRKQLRSCCDDNVFAAILISIVPRAGLARRLN